MSQHDVEDLVEYSVRAVLEGGAEIDAQRMLIAQLYTVQYWFDTSDTFGRLAKELARIEFDPDSLPEKVDILTLIPALIAASPQAERQSLLHQWIAFLAQIISEATPLDDLPATFDALHKDERALALRELGQSLDVRRYRGPAIMKLRKWSGYTTDISPDVENGIADYYTLRFFADLDTSIDKISALYEKQQKKNKAALHGSLTQLGRIVEEMRPDLKLIDHERDGLDQNWVFAITDKGSDDPANFSFLIRFTADLALIDAKILVTSAALKRWQILHGKSDDYHFSMNYFLLLSQEAIDGDASIHYFGGWKFSASASEKLLRKRLAALFSHWDVLKKVFRFHSKSLEQMLDQSNSVALEAKRKSKRDKYGFFVTDIALIFAYACRAWDRGEKPDALIAQIREQLTHVHDSYDLKPAWEASLKRLEKGADFPVGHAPFPYRYIN